MQLVQLDDIGYDPLVSRALRCEQAATIIMDPSKGREVFAQSSELLESRKSGGSQTNSNTWDCPQTQENGAGSSTSRSDGRFYSY